MIVLKDINVTFNKGTHVENQVLKNLNLQIEEGEFITVIGGNGAGKSTMMNVLTGDVIPNSGSVLIDGKDLTQKTTHQRAGLIARIFQDPMVGTFSHLTILENLCLAHKRGQSRGMSSAKSKDLQDEFARRLRSLDMGLETRMQDRVSLLSGGQRQALSLVMATLQKAKILLLDEHTAALDPKTARLILELSEKMIQDYKLTTLMITHSMTQALSHGTRTLAMQQGIIAKDWRGEERKSLTASDLIKFFE